MQQSGARSLSGAVGQKAWVPGVVDHNMYFKFRSLSRYVGLMRSRHDSDP